MVFNGVDFRAADEGMNPQTSRSVNGESTFVLFVFFGRRIRLDWNYQTATAPWNFR